MFQVVAFLLLMLSCNSFADVTDGTELLLTFLIHRHGDRTPVQSFLKYSNQPEELAELSAPYGYGQLTPRGKRRAYAMGESLRNRYDELLGPTYNFSQVYIRSTDSTRAKMSILSALAAIYPPTDDHRWSDVLDWLPIPYTTVPSKYDFNLAFANCPAFSDEYKSLGLKSPLLAEYSDALSVLSKRFNTEVTDSSMLIYSLYDLYVSQISLGLPLDEDIADVIDDLGAAANVAVDLLFGDPNYIAYQAGVLLQQFYEYSALVIDGADTQRVRIYSAHDFNVYSFEAVAQITPRQGVPKYSSVFALELRKVFETGQIVVLPVYLPEPGEEAIYLQVDGCDQLCDYNQFVEITQPYSFDEKSWRSECGFTEDIVIDESSFQ